MIPMFFIFLLPLSFVLRFAVDRANSCPVHCNKALHSNVELIEKEIESHSNDSIACSHAQHYRFKGTANCKCGMHAITTQIVWWCDDNRWLIYSVRAACFDMSKNVSEMNSLFRQNINRQSVREKHVNNSLPMLSDINTEYSVLRIFSLRVNNIRQDKTR